MPGTLRPPRGSRSRVGNDYNDEDVLAWAGTARVTANAPEDLRLRHPAAPGNDHGGVAAAVREWLATGAR